MSLALSSLGISSFFLSSVKPKLYKLWALLFLRAFLCNSAGLPFPKNLAASFSVCPGLTSTVVLTPGTITPSSFIFLEAFRLASLLVVFGLSYAQLCGPFSWNLVLVVFPVPTSVTLCVPAPPGITNRFVLVPVVPSFVL